MSTAQTEPARLTDDDVARTRAILDPVLRTLDQVVIGQEAAVRDVLIALCADGHVLLEGVPGVAKTLLARALASCLDLRFSRVQFTPDLMPTDLLGARIWDAGKREWELHAGPIFADVVLADEINRTPPKTQAALLEAMEERQVTIDGERHDLGHAFFVIATENPLELEGTYPLPEAQTDRFLLQVIVGYPPAEAELELMRRGARHRQDLPPALVTRDQIAHVKQIVARVLVDDVVRRYALSLVHATRNARELKLGASPRAGLMLLRAAQASALLDGRAFVLPDDVKQMARPVLRHRLALSTEAELDGATVDHVLGALLDRLPVLPASG